MADQEYFNHVRGGLCLYSAKAADANVDVRFALGYVGECPELLVQKCWEEHPGDFVWVPVFARGNAAPRRELCTPQSLAAALQTVQLEPGSALELRFKELARALGVAWPSRL